MYPFLNLAKALLSRGHRVTFLGPSIYEHLAQQAGLSFHALGTREQYLAVIDDPDLWNSRKAFGVVWRSARDVYLNVCEFVQSLPTTDQCVLLVHPLALPAAALARAARNEIRIVGAYLAPANLRTCHDPLMVGPVPIPRWFSMRWRRWLWRQVDARIIDPSAVPDLNAQRQSRGLPPVKHLIEHMHNVADISITLFPSWFAKSQSDWPSPLYSGEFQLYEPSPNQGLSPELTRFLALNESPIVFTAGTAHRHAATYFGKALQAVQRIGRCAIFVTRYREQLPAELPSTVLWQDYVSFRALLPHASLLVHHGGIGTTAEALRAGVPQLVVPMAHDQFDNGARVRALGVGGVLAASRLRVGTLAKMLHDLLASTTVRARCDIVAARFSQDQGIDALCRVIESIGDRSSGLPIRRPCH